jgi:hypothetical protein
MQVSDKPANVKYPLSDNGCIRGATLPVFGKRMTNACSPGMPAFEQTCRVLAVTF